MRPRRGPPASPRAIWHAVHVLAASMAVDAAFLPRPDFYCGGAGDLACTGAIGANKPKGAGAFGTAYAYMADVSLPACEAKCKELDCLCFDFSATPARVNENCRVCGLERTFNPLHPSGAGCTAYLNEPDEWGWHFVLLFLAGGTMYISIGLLHGTRVQRKRGWEAVPNVALWREFGGLVDDGLRFARGGQGPVRRSAAPAASKPGQAAGAGSAKQSSRKGGGKNKEAKKTKAVKEDKLIVGGSPPPTAAGVSGLSAPLLVAAAVEGTAAGGGGRWVHVPT